MGVIEGRVTDPEGKPILDVTLAIVEGTTEFPEIAVFTDEEGEYGFPEVSAGTFEVAAHKEGYVRKVARVVVRAGRSSTLDFELKPDT